jgi:O-antigen ligase
MRKRKPERDYLYAIPFGALILFTNINFSTGEQGMANSGGGAFTMYIRLAIYALALYPLIIKPQSHFPWLVKKWPFLLLLIYVSTSILWSSYPSGVIESTIHFIGGALGAFAASIYFSKHQEHLFTYLSILFGFAVVVSLITVFALPEIGFQDFKWEGVSRWRGASGNPNTLGRMSAIAIWANTIGLLNSQENKKLKLLHIVIIGASITTLIGSDSKTSLALSGLFVVLIFLLPQILGRNVKKRRKINVLLTYFLLILVSIALVFSYKPSEDQALSKAGRDSSYSGRTYIWEDASALINMKPIIGWSFDGRRSAYDKIDPGAPHFHNGYLDFMVRGGMVGILILMILYARTAWRVYRKSKRRPYIYSHLAAFLLVILIYNMSEVSLGAWSDIMWTMLLFIYFLSERSKGRRKKRRSSIRTKPSLDSEENESSVNQLLAVIREKKLTSSLALAGLGIGLAATLSIVMTNEKEPIDRLNPSELVSKNKDSDKWRGIVFAPEYKTSSKDYIKNFKLLVTEALAPIGINLIIFDMHWSNYQFTSIPEIPPLQKPPYGVVTAQDAKDMAEICRKNGIRVMVGMNFLTHQSYGQLLKTFPQYQWPGNEKLWNPLNTEVNNIAFKMADELLESFGAEGFHVGMDEGWGFNVKNLPEASNYSTAELFAKAINQYHDHFVNEKGVEMMMWSDMLEERYADAPVGEAISMIPKDIILMSWDYECHWKRYPGLGRYIEKIIPICPWDSKWPSKLADNGFRVMVSPWKNPLAAKELIKSTSKIKKEKFKGVLYTTWSPNVVYDLKDALLDKHTEQKIDPTIVGVAKSIHRTIDHKQLLDN